MQNVLTLGQQLENFRLYRNQIVNMVGPQNASRIISGALFAISMGTVDFTGNYFVNPLAGAHLYTVTEYQDLLLQSLSGFTQVIILSLVELSLQE